MNKLLIKTIACSLLVSAQIAHSASGLYAGLGLGASSLGEFQEATTTDTTGFAGKVFAGYKFTEYLGIETSFAKLHTQNYSLDVNRWISFDYELSAFSIAAKLFLPLSDRSRFNFSIGGAEMFGHLNAKTIFGDRGFYKDSTSRFGGMGGIGAEFDLSEHFTTSIDVTAYGKQNGDDGKLGVPFSTLFTVGLAYQF